MSAGRLPVPLGAIVTSAVSFWICFAIVAGATRSAPSHATTAHPKREAASRSVRLGLSPVPALRVRAAPALLQGPAAIAPVQPTTARPRPTTTTTAPAAPARATPQPAPAMQPQPMAAPKPVATPQPRATPQPKPTAARKRPASKFDEAGPNPKSFDSTG